MPPEVFFFFFFFSVWWGRGDAIEFFVVIGIFYFDPWILYPCSFLYTYLYSVSLVTKQYTLALAMLFPLTAITFYVLFYVNGVLCSLGVGEKRKIWMLWKGHPFPTPFLSSAPRHLPLCCQKACFPEQIQGRNRYALPDL